jgi:osmotically-inducible protein OsmY
MGRWSNNQEILPGSSVQATGPVDASKARDVGAKVGQATADAANEAADAVKNGRITAKIKSKMALDDMVKARNINVDTNGSVVTLTGSVSSDVERKRAVQLARDTEGVTSVVDNLQVR